MRTGAIVCFVFSVISTLTGARNVLAGANRPERGDLFVSYVVGSFLLPVVFLIVGLILWQKAANQNVDE